MPDPLHITHVALALDMGGLERVVLNLAREGVRLGQRVSVVCLERPGGLAPEFETIGVRVHCVNKQPGLRPFIIPRLRSVFARLRTDVAHTHQIGALLYAGPAARWAGVRVIVHTEHGKHYSRRQTRHLGRLASRFTDTYACVSSDIAREVAEHRITSPHKVAVIPNGIETARFAMSYDTVVLRESLCIPTTAIVVGTLGNLREVKRHDVLIRGFARMPLLNRELPHLLIVGDGPLKSDLQELARELGVNDRVHFAGHQPRPDVYLKAMDVFALTSRSEGMPLCVLEAWAAGLPVVASRVGGLPELIEHGQTGLLFPSGDDVALAAELQKLCFDTAIARSIAQAGHARVLQRYDVSAMASTYQSRYLDLLRRHNPSVSGTHLDTSETCVGSPRGVNLPNASRVG